MQDENQFSNVLASLWQLLKKVLFYSISIGAEAAIAAALMPMLTGKIAPDEFGLWVLFVSLFSFVRPLISLMLQDLLRMNFFQRTPVQLLGDIRAAITLPSFVFLLTLVLSQIFASELESIFAFPADGFWLVVLVAYLHGFFYTVQALLQFREQHALFLSLQVIQALLAVGLTYVLVQMDLSWWGAGLARSVALLVVNIVGLCWVLRVFGNPFSLDISYAALAHQARAGFGFLIVGLSGVVVPLSSRVVLTRLVSAEETGYFGIANMFSLVIYIFIQGFIFAWQPMLFRALQIGEKNEAPFIRFSYAYFVALPLFSGLTVLAAVIIGPYLVKYDFLRITPYLFSVAAMTCIQGYYLHNHTWLHALNRLRIISWTAFAIMPINLILCILFVRHMGGVGAAWGAALTYLLATICTWASIRQEESAKNITRIVLQEGSSPC